MTNRPAFIALASTIGVAVLGLWLLRTDSDQRSGGDTKTSIALDPLRPGLTIRVEDEAGGKLPGVAVGIRGSVVLEGVTEVGGLVDFDDIPAGSYRVRISAAGYPELRSASQLRVTFGAHEEIRCVVRQYDVSISGKVMNASGVPLAGVTTQCAPLRRQDDEILMERIGSPRRVKSDEDGEFEITGLAVGEYSLNTEPHPGYSQARHNIAAPSEGVLMVLNAEHSLVISGMVTDRDLQPLEAAVVVVAGGGNTQTNDEGRYRLLVKVNRAPGSTLVLSARKAGYAAQHKTTAVTERPANEELALSFRLDPVTDAGTLLGTLMDRSGTPIPDESVYLQSVLRGAHYQATVTADGQFRFEAVRFADDYVLTVFPVADYWDATLQTIGITSEVRNLEVVLEPIEEGILSGALVDAVGAPVPHFTFWVKNLKKRASSMLVTSDSHGRFRAPVPAGDLVIETRGLPKLTVRGLHVDPEQGHDATIQIGIGDRSVRGQVLLPDGSPIAGAQIVVTWSAQVDGVRSSLFHETLSDTAGSFDLLGLGPGKCVVSVSAVGVSSTRKSFEIPREGDPDPIRIELR